MTDQEQAARRDAETIRRCQRTSHDGNPRAFLRSCSWCDQPFWVKDAGGTRRYCGIACQMRAQHHRWRDPTHVEYDAWRDG
jgi:hypothetical protein